MPDHGGFFREQTSFKFFGIKRNTAVERKLSSAAGDYLFNFLPLLSHSPPWL
jgi:hypothetical protein